MMNTSGELTSNPGSTSQVPSPTVPDVHVEGPLATGERFRPIALAALTLVLVALCILLLIPFLSAVTWAVALAVVAWPLHAWVARRINRPGLAAAVSTLAVLILIFIPSLFVAYRLAMEAGSVTEQVQEAPSGAPVRETMARTPGLVGVVDWMDRVGVDVDHEARKIVAAYTRDVSGLVQGSLSVLVQSLVAMFLLYFLFRDSGSLTDGLRRLLPLTRTETERVFDRFAGAIHANVYANVITSVVDGIIGGLLFWSVGLPSPALWGVVMFVFALLPMLGAWTVWIPAALYLMLTHKWLAALLLVGTGVATWIIVDNALYMRLAGGRMGLHQVPVLIAFLGGLAVFGPSGIILGPVVLAVTVAVLEVWHRRVARGATESPPGTNHSR